MIKKKSSKTAKTTKWLIQNSEVVHELFDSYLKECNFLSHVVLAKLYLRIKFRKKTLQNYKGKTSQKIKQSYALFWTIFPY